MVVDKESEKPYNRILLIYSLKECFAHDPEKGENSIWWLVESIESKILDKMYDQSSDRLSISKEDLSDIIINTLGNYDKSAKIQYLLIHHKQRK